MNKFCPYCGRKDHGFACPGMVGIEFPPEPEDKPVPKPAPGNEPVTRRKRPRLHKGG